MAGGQVIFELVRVGNSVKVTAIDPATLIEASIVGPATADEAALRRAALRKLDYVRRRKDVTPP
jgi:hypothetical protein